MSTFLEEPLNAMAAAAEVDVGSDRGRWKAAVVKLEMGRVMWGWGSRKLGGVV